jgi:phosphoribosylformylglycinamidine synthase
MRWGVVVFPGSCDDDDVVYALENVMGEEVRRLWHKDALEAGYDAIVLPGGFSYGDYLRAGAMARFSPLVRGIVDFANNGGLVLGICNGFQILCEAGLLPGALTRNASLRFVCKRVFLRVERTDTPFTCLARPGQLWRLPIKHGEGRYYADEATLDRLDRNHQVVVRYVTEEGRTSAAANPNGSLDHIAGICNEKRNVFGLMPHPEDATERILGSESGLKLFESMITSCGARSSVSGIRAE